MIQFITHENAAYGYVEGARLALTGGCRWIQLRMKDATDEEVIAAGRKIKTLCKAYKATFIIDDRVHLVDAVQADGVHLGRKDMPVDEARKLLGKDKIIGGTANTFDDVRRLYEAGADYIGCGPYRFTTTKKNLSPILGIEGYRSIMALMKENGIALPIVAIGGILLQDVKELMKTGISGIAVSGAILNSTDPVREARLFEDAARVF